MQSTTPSSRGRPQCYSDLAITTALVVKRAFRLILRAAQGFIDSLFAMMDVPPCCPDYTCVSKRAKSVNVRFKTLALSLIYSTKPHSYHILLLPSSRNTQYHRKLKTKHYEKLYTESRYLIMKTKKIINNYKKKNLIERVNVTFYFNIHISRHINMIIFQAK